MLIPAVKYIWSICLFEWVGRLASFLRMLESLIVSAGTPSGGTAGSIAAAGVVRIGLRSSTGGGARAATGNPRSDFRIRPAGPLPTISLISIFFAAAMRAAKGLILILPASLA